MTDWSTLKKLIWLRIIKGGGSALRTVTGAIAHVTNALALPAEALSVNVEPIQDLHGYDSPWPAGGGRNLLDPWKCSAVEPSSAYGLTVTHNQATETWTISGTPSSQSQSLAFNFCTYSDFSLSGKGYAVQAFPISGTPIKNFYGFRNETENKIAIMFDSVANPTINVSFKISVAATSQTAWSPYSNICPISGRTSATVTRTGKNLLKLVESEMRNVGWNREFPLSIKAGTYTLSCQNKFIVGSLDGCRITLQDDDNNNIAMITTGYNFGNVEFSKTSVITEEMANAITKISFEPRTSGCTFANIMDAEIMLELGSTASAYEPYAGNTYTITLGETVYGGTLDVTGGKMVVDRAMADLGTLPWIYRSNLSGMSAALSPTAKDRFNAVCSIYSYGGPYNELNDKQCGYVYNNQVFVKDSDYTDATTFASAMNGQQLCYELATPIEITLTPTQIDTLLGTNNVWSDAGDSTLTYYVEGKASTSEALGILLGGTYNNPGGADDASDDEALGILLGGS